MSSGVLGRRASRASGGPPDNSSDQTYDPNGPRLQSEPPRKTVESVIENMGTGLAQLRVAALTSPVHFADGAELQLISSVARTVSAEWGFNGFQRSAVVSVVFVGICIGNITGGPMADQLGRRLPILLSFLFIFVTSLFSALAWGFKSLCFFRFLAGIAIGVGQPVQRTMMNEVTASKWRVVFSIIPEFAFAIGASFTGVLLLLDDPEMRTLHWRLLIVVSAIPSAVFGLLACAFLRQSPLFLAICGRYEETKAELEFMREENEAHQVSVDFKPRGEPCAGNGGGGTPHSVARQFSVVFGSELLVTSIIMMLSCFNMNLSYYGAMYSFPQIMVGGVEFGRNPAENLIYGALVEIVGVFLAMPCVSWSRRKFAMRVYFVVTALVFFAFAVGCSGGREVRSTKLYLYFGYYGVNLSKNFGFVALYTYATEVYPTIARGTGTALCLASGRLASIAAPMIYELLQEGSDGKFEIFFYTVVLIDLVNVPMVGFLPIETFGKPLREEGQEACAKQSDD